MSKIKSLISLLKYAFTRYKIDKLYLKRVGELDIESNGITKEGLAFIKIKNGFTFHGYKSDSVQEFIYKYFIPKKIKSKLENYSLNIALDVSRRFLPHLNLTEAQRKSRFLDIKEGDIVVEGVAFIGLYAMQLSKLVGQHGKVIAIEAIKENFDILKKNIESNHIKNIIPVNNALWNEKKKISFFRNSKQVASFTSELVDTKNTYDVDANTLDNILEEININKVDFVRLQINGAELKALSGMHNVMTQYPQMLIAAPYTLEGNSTRIPIDKYLKSVGFKTDHVLGNVCANINSSYIS